MDTAMPSVRTPKPTPTKTGNPNEVDVASFATPTMNSAIPAMMLATMRKMAIKTGTLELVVALMLAIDSRNSSGEMIPLSWTGKVESNSALQHPARKKMFECKVASNEEVNGPGTTLMVTELGCIGMTYILSDASWYRMSQVGEVDRKSMQVNCE